METIRHNFISVRETAEYLGIPLPTAYYLVQRGEIPAVRIGSRWRVKKDALDRDVLHSERPSLPAVLVADDEPGVQAMFTHLLNEQGFPRVIVGTGREAIAALKKRKFDLCFLDLFLEDCRGDKIYARAKVVQPNLPIVIITGFPDSQALDNILSLGSVTVLKKPFPIESVQEMLKMLGAKPNR